MKIAEILSQAYRFVYDLLAILVVANLHIAGQRKILPQRMTFKTVIRKDAAVIGQAGKHHAQ